MGHRARDGGGAEPFGVVCRSELRLEPARLPELRPIVEPSVRLREGADEVVIRPPVTVGTGAVEGGEPLPDWENGCRAYIDEDKLQMV